MWPLLYFAICVKYFLYNLYTSLTQIVNHYISGLYINPIIVKIINYYKYNTQVTKIICNESKLLVGTSETTRKINYNISYLILKYFNTSSFNNQDI